MRASWQLLTRLAAVALAGVVVGAGAGCGGAIGRDELARSLQTVASVAAEGQLMAHDVSRNRARSSFVRAHARELSDSADHEGEKLADATTAADLAGPLARAVALARQVSIALAALQITPADGRVGCRAGAQLRRYGELARRLVANL